MKKLFLLFTIILLTTFIFSSCQKDQAIAPAQAQAEQESPYYTPNLSDFVTDRSGYWTEIPAGSVDALNAAIAEADEGGVIYLKAGMHTETKRVTINKRVKIIGEDGAVLKIASSDTVSTLNPAVFITNAPGTAIQNVEIQPHGDGANSAIVFNNSPESALLSNKISGFIGGVVIEKSDRVALIKNTLSDGTKSGNGILVNRGSSAYVAENEISGFDIGLFACDRWGTAEKNNFHDNYVGMLLCKYDAIFGSTVPGISEPIGAVPCQGWKIRNNKFTENLYGLSVRDGSNLNFVEINNEYSSNSDYDIIIPADELIDVPGFYLFIPTAYNNSIHATPDVLIKSCGVNNTINGGTLVDTTVDPC